MALNLKIKNQTRRAEYINALDLPVRASTKFIDLKLDLQQEVTGNPLYFDQNVVNAKDIAIAKDEEAIKEYLKNLFACAPGDLYLNPDFGLNLKKYIFEPITERTAQDIGNTIDYTLTDQNFFGDEDMVELKKVYINPNIDKGQFELVVIVRAIQLQKEITLFGTISPKDGVLFSSK